jgi:hypothetical protein
MRHYNEMLDEITFPNIPNAFGSFLQRVKKHVKKGFTPIFGLEDVGEVGRSLALYLLEQEIIVKAVNSALSYSVRKSYPTTQKSDSWDEECVARVLLSKLDILPDANPQDIYWTIGQLMSRRTGLIKAHIALKNQLHSQLKHHYPSYKKFFCDIDGKCSLVFWHTFPSSELLEDMEVEDLAKILRKASHNTCSINKAEGILDLVKQDGETARAYQHFRDFLIQSYVRDIRFKQDNYYQLGLGVLSLGLSAQSVASSSVNVIKNANGSYQLSKEGISVGYTVTEGNISKMSINYLTSSGSVYKTVKVNTALIMSGTIDITSTSANMFITTESMK